MTRRGVLRAAGHAVAYLVLLVGLLALTDLHVGWNLDDGIGWGWAGVVSPMTILSVGPLSFAALFVILVRQIGSARVIAD